MNKIFNLFKASDNIKNKQYIKPQKFVEAKRAESTVTFIYPEHPLYDSIVSNEENKLHILAPNETAYNENSFTNMFAAIVTYNENSYLLVKSLKHFKEQSIGGLLQFDETIYQVIPFIENENEYQTAGDFSFHETYEYDHPVENYYFIAQNDARTTRMTLERGKSPLTVTMIDSERPLFSSKLTQQEIELIDYVVIPGIEAYGKGLNKRSQA